jgi:hypothetical protein
MRYLTSTVFFSICLASHSFGQLTELERLTEIQNELDQTQESLFELESDYGRLDRRLLEPLDQVSASLIENERFSDAHTVLDQAIQIIRVSEGLYSSTQFPLVIRNIENKVLQGDWTDAKELMQHLSWLIGRGENEVNEELVTTILDLIDIHLWGVVDDLESNQSFHFKRAERLTNFVNTIARHSYVEGDSRVTAIMYKKVVQMYLQSIAVEVGGPTGISLRSFSSIGYAISRGDAQDSLYYAGIRSLGSIRDFYLRSDTPNLEGAGIALMYRGDWEILFGKNLEAQQAYERGHELLLESGQTQEAINRFTSQPKMLPLLDFYATLDSAAALDSDSIAAAESDSSISNFTFRQWSSQFPKASAPIRRGLQEFNQRDGEYAMFSFNLVGMDRANRWYRGRYKRNISSPQNLELVRQQISSSVDMVELAESIKDFHYRPKFINGEPQTVNATLVFQLAD